MSIVQQRIGPVRRQLDTYEESWKRDHAAIQECWACEDLIHIGRSVGLILERFDRSWRDRVFRGVDEYLETDDELIRSSFELWLTVSTAILRWASRLEAAYGSVEGATEIREMIERVKGHFDRWQPPTLSRSVGLREVVLSSEAVEKLEETLAAPPPPPVPPPPPEMTSEELAALLRR